MHESAIQAWPDRSRKLLRKMSRCQSTCNRGHALDTCRKTPGRLPEHVSAIITIMANKEKRGRDLFERNKRNGVSWLLFNIKISLSIISIFREFFYLIYVVLLVVWAIFMSNFRMTMFRESHQGTPTCLIVKM